MKLGKSVSSGFTLIELAVVIAVGGLLALASIPSIVSYIQDYRLDGAISNLVSDLHLLKHRAIAEGNDFVVTLDPDADTYTVFDDDNCNGSPDAGEAVMGIVQLPGGLRLENGPQLPFPDNTIILKPNGTANATGVLTIANKHGRQRLLMVLASTGYAKKLREYNTEIENH